MGNVIGIQALILAAALGAAPQQGGAPAPPAEPAPAPQANPPIELPVSLTRIQKALSRPPAIKPTTNRPVFRVEVFARKPTIEDILGPDYLLGPVPASGMTHQEFLHMVTPVEYRGMSMFTNGEAMTLAAVGLAFNWALMKAIDKLKEARTERAKEAARREVLQAMNELEAARKKAGLPPK
ncbi:MAG TPA: hypothetical protein VJ813_12320 [Vicinamibacterales bacterium]|nr:hypothetical protein [Vicinamibacterales bacterium]